MEKPSKTQPACVIRTRLLIERIRYVNPWDMLNNFCFLVYAQMLMFMGENDNGYFSTAAAAAGPLPVSQPIIELVPS